jgi:hypothetical protein
VGNVCRGQCLWQGQLLEEINTVPSINIQNSKTDAQGALVGQKKFESHAPTRQQKIPADINSQ